MGRTSVAVGKTVTGYSELFFFPPEVMVFSADAAMAGDRRRIETARQTREERFLENRGDISVQCATRAGLASTT